METASYIWNDYLRLNIFWVFLAGLAFVIYGTRDRWRAYQQAQQIPRWKNGTFNGDYFIKAGAATFRVLWPIWLWMLLFGIPATIADAILGPQ